MAARGRRSSVELAAKNAPSENKHIVTVFTGNSNTGSSMIEALLASYADTVHIRAVVRTSHQRKNPKYEAVYERFGSNIEIVVADITNKSQIESLFKDCKVAFWATPDNHTSDRVELTKRFVDECIAHRVDYPIIISMVDAGFDGSLSVPDHLKEMIELENYALSKIGQKTALRSESHTDVGEKVLQPIILRCGQFHENFYGMAALFEAGVFHFPLAEGRIPSVSLKDVGACSAKIAANPQQYVPTSDRKVWNLISSFISGGDVARAFTMVNYGTKYDATISDADAAAAFQAAHMDARHARRYVELLKYYRERWPGDDTDEMIPVDDIQTILGRRATPISAFARSMAPFLIAKREEDLDPIVEGFKRGWVTWSDTVVNVNSQLC